MRRAALATLAVISLLSCGFWAGRNSVTFLPSDTELRDQMNQEVNHLEELKEGVYRREVWLKTASDPLHRFGGPPCLAGD